jgi:hypothetical protein
MRVRKRKSRRERETPREGSLGRRERRRNVSMGSVSGQVARNAAGIGADSCVWRGGWQEEGLFEGRRAIKETSWAGITARLPSL